MKAAVIGAGGWGCALSVVLSNNGHEVTVWSKFQNEIDGILATGENQGRLPGIKLPETIKYTTDEQVAVEGAEVIVFAVPSSFVRVTAENFKAYITEEQVIVNVAKGIEDGSLFSLQEVVNDVMPNIEVAVLSGPSHAEEVARQIPTSVVVASKDKSIVKKMQNAFMNENFRVYGSSDMIGVEMGGALKNVIALAAGISDGLGYGDNTKAALMTRGMAEISRLGVAMGADKETFSGLTGIGDLIVTCTSMHSRNRRAGILIGKGAKLDEALDEVKMVVEGVYSAKAAYDLSVKYQVSMPIIEQVNAVLFGHKDPKQAVMDLMNRAKKFEV